jgi:hypothetical protein
MHWVWITCYLPHPVALSPFWYIHTTPSLILKISVLNHCAPSYITFCVAKFPLSLSEESCSVRVE